MLLSFGTGPVFVQKKLYLIIFINHSNLRQPNNSENNGNISAINCWFWLAFDEEAGQYGQFLSR